MWCTTECWDCEDRNCEHYISKTVLYFNNKHLKQKLKDIKEYIEKQLNNPICDERQTLNIIKNMIEEEEK